MVATQIGAKRDDTQEEEYFRRDITRTFPQNKCADDEQRELKKEPQYSSDQLIHRNVVKLTPTLKGLHSGAARRFPLENRLHPNCLFAILCFAANPLIRWTIAQLPGTRNQLRPRLDQT